MLTDGDLQPSGAAAGDALAAVPPTPVVKQEEIWFDSPFTLVKDGRYTLGWQRWPVKKGGPGFVTLRRNALGNLKIVERYPLTDAGWAQAWRAFVELDPLTAQQVLDVLARRAQADTGHAERARLEASSLAFLPEVIFLGGYIRGTDLAAGTPYDLRFLAERLIVHPRGRLEALAEIPYGSVEAVDIDGPGLVKSGGGFVGGGFGVAGAAEGMAIAAVLNALTTRTTIKTVVRVQASGAELFVLNTTVTPEALRISLSRALGAIREAQASATNLAPTPQNSGTGSVIDELSRLAGLLDSGLLTREEFDRLKAKLIAGH
jgi:Short C-terminal domain